MRVANIRTVIAGLASEGAFKPDDRATLRKGEANDATRLTLLLQNHYNWINVYNSPFAVIQRKTSVIGMQNALAEFPSVVAEVDDVVIGFAITFPQEPSLMQIRVMYVDDPYRGRGIASSMIPMLEEQILSAGYGMVMGTSSTLWFPGKKLPTRIFERCGYQVVPLGTHNDTEMYIHELGSARPLRAVADPKQLFGIRSISFPEDQ